VRIAGVADLKPSDADMRTSLIVYSSQSRHDGTRV
jgi:hypothetical protein